MAKLTAPLLSMGAQGQIGKSIVMSEWRGVKYAKSYSTPANPRTSKQTELRNVFTMLNDFWKLAPSMVIDAFDAGAKGRKFTGRNLFISKNQKVLYDDPAKTSMLGLIGSPGALGGSAPSAVVATGGANQVSLSITLPETPSGWTLVGSNAIAFEDQAPSVDWTKEVYSNQETGSPETNVITGLDAATDYVVAAWLEWTKPDGKTAYSVSLSDEATTDA